MRNKIFIAIFLIVFTIGAVSAAEDNATSDNVAVSNDLNELALDQDSDVLADGNQTFSDISNLINGASNGDTINLSGYYYGSGSDINVNKVVTINGVGETVLDAKKLSNIFYISSSNVKIKNIKFVNGSNSGDWGGAIYCDGYDNVEILNCTFVNNAASWGAGIFWSGTDGYMANCTFENNTAERYGGALYVNGDHLRMLNSTFKNNVVTNSITQWEGGGAIYTDGTNHIVANSTFIENSATNSWGGAIKHGSDTATYQSNTFYNNTALRGNSVWESYAENLLGNVFNLNSIDEIDSCVEDANLSAVFDTNTFKVKNVVISKEDYFGNSSSNNTGNQNITVINSTFSVLANLIAGTDEECTLELTADYHNDGSYSSEGIKVAKSITIDGKGHTISTLGNTNVFSTDDEGSYNLKNIIFVNTGRVINYDLGAGGNIENCTFINCSSNGPILSLDGGYSGMVSNCKFINCSVNHEWPYGVVYNGGSGCDVINCIFEKCTGSQWTSAICFDAGGSGSINNCSFLKCSSTGADASGGAILISAGSSADIINSNFTDCYSEGNGGAISFDGPGTVNNCTFENCTAKNGGGAIYVMYDNLNVFNSTFIGCTAGNYGGAIHVEDEEYSIVRVSSSNFKNNKAKSGGAVMGVTIFDCELDSNSKPEIASSADFAQVVPYEIVSNDDGIITLKFPSDAEGRLAVFIDGTKVAVANVVNGIAKIDLSEYKGNYVLTFEYSGDDNYDGFVKNSSVRVYVNPTVIVAKNLNVLYNSGSKCTITIYSEKGVLAPQVSVVIKLNNKNFKTPKTDSKGVISFKITQVPGTYKLKIVSLEKTKTATLTVKHLVTLKSATVKKSAKKLVLTATLAKVNKKYLKNKKITFKFNGKKYTAKTNKKGVAKVTIKSNVLKKLKVGKKVTYQATYLKDTVKKTVKIKK